MQGLVEVTTSKKVVSLSPDFHVVDFLPSAMAPDASPHSPRRS